MTKVNRPTNYTYTIRVYDVNGDHDTGIGKVTIGNTTKAGGVTINEISSSQVVATGETLHHHLNIMGVGHQPMVIEHPVI